MLMKQRDDFRDACQKGLVPLLGHERCKSCGHLGIFRSRWDSGLLVASCVAEYCPHCNEIRAENKMPHPNRYEERMTLLARMKRRIIEDSSFLAAMHPRDMCPSCGCQSYYHEISRGRFRKPDRLRLCINPDCNWPGAYN